MLELADAGLTGRAEEDWFGQDERQFLTALRGIAESGRTPADEKLELFHGRWRGASTRSSPSSRTDTKRRKPDLYALVFGLHRILRLCLVFAARMLCNLTRHPSMGSSDRRSKADRSQ